MTELKTFVFPSLTQSLVQTPPKKEVNLLRPTGFFHLALVAEAYSQGGVTLLLKSTIESALNSGRYCLPEMSLSFGGAVQITNNLQEQESNVLKKAKMDDGQPRTTQQGQKRAALGTITNNVGVRIQPFRAAKQQVRAFQVVSSCRGNFKILAGLLLSYFLKLC